MWWKISLLACNLLLKRTSSARLRDFWCPEKVVILKSDTKVSTLRLWPSEESLIRLWRQLYLLIVEWCLNFILFRFSVVSSSSGFIVLWWNEKKRIYSEFHNTSVAPLWHQCDASGEQFMSHTRIWNCRTLKQHRCWTISIVYQKFNSINESKHQMKVYGYCTR